MNDDSSNPKAPVSAAGWWWVWIACVVGGPVVTTVIAITGSGQKQGSSAGLGLMVLVGGIALVGHAIASFMLGRKLEQKRLPEHRQGAAIKIGLGLLFGGWCVMPVMFFIGCFIGLATQ